MKWFNDNKGFGFVMVDGKRDVFVHHSKIVMDGFRTLREGAAVSIEWEESEKGPSATEVRPL